MKTKEEIIQKRNEIIEMLKEETKLDILDQCDSKVFVLSELLTLIHWILEDY